MTQEFLKEELKQLILDAIESHVSVDDLSNTDHLFGAESRLNMDSLDALQVSVAIQKKYGVRLADSKETRRALVSIDALADYLSAQMGH